MSSNIKPKHQYFLKVDVEFLTKKKLFAFASHRYHSGENEEKYAIQLKAEADTEGECIEAVFEYAESLRDALTRMIDERAKQNSLSE